MSPDPRVDRHRSSRETLRQRLDRNRQLPFEEAVRIAAGVARTLHDVHAPNGVHGAVHPGNIVLHGADVTLSEPVPGADPGEALYAAPEHDAVDGALDGRSDIYSLGCVLYEMIGGVPPFTGPSHAAIRARHASGEVPPLSTIRAATPPTLEALVRKSLARRPKDRFRSAEHLVWALSDPRITAEVPGVRSGPWPSWVKAALAVAVVGGAAFGMWRWWHQAPADPRAGVVAVLPFEVQGEFERPLDAASIATLLRNYFGLLERYRTVPGDAVAEAVAEHCPTPAIERSCGTAVAGRLGAQFHVTGTVAAVGGDSVHIIAFLADELDGRAIPAVSVRGSRENGAGLLNELYRELAIASATEGERVASNAALSTENLVAFAALLDGELYMADGNFDAATAAFRSAVAADSTFALAWYRLAVLYDWNNFPDWMLFAIERAEEHSHHLSRHDQRFLPAFKLMAGGRALEAEPIFLGLLDEDPNDVEALFQLGKLRWAYIWRQGRSQAEAIDPLRRALELAPRHEMAASFFVWSLAAAARTDEIDSVQAIYQFPGYDHASRAIRTHRLGDSLGFRVAMDSIAGLHPFDETLATLFVIHGTTHDAIPDFGAIRPVLEVNEFEFGIINLAAIQAGGGRWSEAQETLVGLSVLPINPALSLRASIATALPEGTGNEDIIGLLDMVEEQDPSQVESPIPFVTGTFGVWGEYVKAYLTGLLKSQTGNYEGALEAANRLEAMESVGAFPSTHTDMAHGVRADVLFKQGRFDEALAELDSAHWDINYMETAIVPMVGGERETFLRARVLQELGLYQEALDLYTYGGEQRYLGLAYLAPSHLHRGEIYQELGEREKALWHYGAFTELYREADSEYQPLVEEVKQRMARLAGEGE